MPVRAAPVKSTSTVTASCPERRVTGTAALPEISVAAGILRAPDGRVLITQRPPGKAQGGFWEFPGGKIGVGETPLQGLVRELREELGVAVQVARHLVNYSHDYPDKRVHLHIWIVLAWQGEPAGLEAQPLAWAAPDELLARGLLPADARIVELLLQATPVNRLPLENGLLSRP